jgi:hypothetical protein
MVGTLRERVQSRLARKVAAPSADIDQIIEARVDGHEGCQLPADCEGCQQYTCARCEQVKPWENGLADDLFVMCDECAQAINQKLEAVP